MRKTQLFLTALAMFIGQLSMAQPWMLAGNPNANAVSILGTLSPYALRIFAGGAQRGVVEPNTGFWGISNGVFVPNYRLDVNNGDIDVNTTTNGYRLGGTNPNFGYVLWNKGIYQNLYVGINSGSLGAGVLNTACGYSSLHSFTIGLGNSATGAYALYFTTTGIWNTADGFGALFSNTTGSYNTGLGNYTLWATTTATNNTAVGDFALRLNVTGNDNTAVGLRALTNNIASSNTAVGKDALYTNTSGTGNSAFGLAALYTNTMGGFNTATGDSAMYHNTLGTYNTANGYQSMKGNPNGRDSYNTAVGARSLYSITTGRDNVAIGYKTLYNSKGASGNTAIGYLTLQNITLVARSNTAIGNAAMSAGPVSGHFNVATGVNTLFSDQAGTCNTADGAFASYFNISGNFNTAIGDESLDNNVKGSNNVAIGHGALKNNMVNNNTAVGYQASLNDNTGTLNTASGFEALQGSANFTGSYNSGMGTQSLFSINAGDSNVANGYNALYDNTDGYNNSALGQRALLTNKTGDSNTAVGSAADVTNPVLMDATAIGADAKVTTNDKMILGNNHNNVGIGMSGIAGGPTNKLELSWYSNSTPTPGGTPGSNISTCSSGGTGESGLQFRDLTSASTSYPYCTPDGNGFLTVDANGNIIKMALPPPIGGLGLCPSLTPVPAGGGGFSLSNTSLANIYIDGNGSGFTNRQSVLIGHPCGTTPLAKLDVLQASGSLTGSTGIYVENDDAPEPAPGPVPIGLEAKLPENTATNAGISVGGWFEAPDDGSGTNIGYSIFVPSEPTGVAPGIVSIGELLGTNYGYLMQIKGSAYADGGTWTPSDRRYKTNLTPITNALQKINSINPVYFYFDTINYAQHGFSSKKQVGFISQNVDSVLPEVVNENDSGYYDLDYSKMTALLLAGMKEQQGIIIRDSLQNVSQQITIDSLRTAFNGIEECIEHLCNDTNAHHSMQHKGNDGNSDNNVQNVTLSTAAILYQNAPNPFGSGGTKINYFLPDGTMGASIVFYDQYGNKLKEVQLTQTGMGSINININPNQLSNGVYTYSLVINGNVVDTKKMVFNK